MVSMVSKMLCGSISKSLNLFIHSGFLSFFYFLRPGFALATVEENDGNIFAAGPRDTHVTSWGRDSAPDGPKKMSSLGVELWPGWSCAGIIFDPANRAL